MAQARTATGPMNGTDALQTKEIVAPALPAVNGRPNTRRGGERP